MAREMGKPPSPDSPALPERNAGKARQQRLSFIPCGVPLRPACTPFGLLSGRYPSCSAYHVVTEIDPDLPDRLTCNARSANMALGLGPG